MGTERDDMSAARQSLARVVAGMRGTGARSMAGGGSTGGKTPTYKRMRGVVEQHTSPFELQQVPTLFANFGKKFKHETVDNIPDLAPAVIVFGVMIAYTETVNAKIKAEHRY